MSVDLKQVREALGDMISYYGEFVGGVVYNEIGETADLDEILKVMRDCQQMADEIEALRAERDELRDAVSYYESMGGTFHDEMVSAKGGNDGNE